MFPTSFLSFSFLLVLHLISIVFIPRGIVYYAVQGGF